MTKCVSCLCSLPSNYQQAEDQNCSNPKKDNAPFVAVLKMVVAASKSCVAGEKWRVAATIIPVIAKKIADLQFSERTKSFRTAIFKNDEVAVLQLFMSIASPGKIFPWAGDEASEARQINALMACSGNRPE